MYVRLLGDDGPLKITTYHVTWLPSRNKAFTYLHSCFTTSADVTTKFDAVFWSGDLNFRILRERDHVQDAVEGIEADGTANYQNLVQHDELFRVMNEGMCIIFHSALLTLNCESV